MTRDPRHGSPRVRRGAVFAIALLVAVVVLAVECAASLVVGSTWIPLDIVWAALTAPDGSPIHHSVTALRVPRTVLAVLVGAAFAVAGGLMQALTRNPLADPGILGVNAGAGFAVTLGVALLGVTRLEQYLGFAFIGAAVTALVVYAIGFRGHDGPTPLRMTLAGVALGAVLSGFSSTLALLDVETFDRMRFWGVGTVSDRPAGTITTIAPFLLIGVVLALLSARPLNMTGLGSELARTLGTRMWLTRTVVFVAVTVLCGAATAAVGPLGFIGLMVPHAVRLVTGPDQRLVLPLCLVGGPVLVLTADMLGRVMVSSELQVGVVTGLLGAPVLVLLARRSMAGAR